jgi:hypothetical protein
MVGNKKKSRTPIESYRVFAFFSNHNMKWCPAIEEKCIWDDKLTKCQNIRVW